MIKYQSVKRLTDAEVEAHLEGMRQIAAQPRPIGKNPQPHEFKTHLEPLALHWAYRDASATIPAMCRIISEETGIAFGQSTLTNTLREWGVPPAERTGAHIKARQRPAIHATR